MKVRTSRSWVSRSWVSRGWVSRGWVLALVLLFSACASVETSNDAAFRREAARWATDIGIAYLGQGRLDLAQARLEHAIEQDPAYALAHGTLALVFDLQGDAARAEVRYRSAMLLSSNEPGVLNSYAVFLCRQSRTGEALEFFDRAAADRRYATPEVALTNAGVCLREANDLVRAEQYLRQAMGINPQYGEATLQLAALFHQRDEHLAARGLVQSYLGFAVATPGVLWLARQVELALGNTVAAQLYAGQLREYFPDAAETRRLDEA